MKFLADMGISQSTVAWLQKQGHDALHVRERGMQRADDADILTLARNEARVLLTLDLDFGYLVAISGAKLPSVIILRLGNETAEYVTSRLEDALNCCQSEREKGVILSVEEATIRMRHLPIERS